MAGAYLFMWLLIILQGVAVLTGVLMPTKPQRDGRHHLHLRVWPLSVTLGVGILPALFFGGKVWVYGQLDYALPLGLTVGFSGIHLKDSGV